MINYKFLAEYGGKKYANIIEKKINFFYLQNKSLPKNIDELRSKIYIAKEDSQIFENRGKLERELNSLQNPSILLLKTVNKEDRGKYLSDNNQLITFNASIFFFNSSGIDIVKCSILKLSFVGKTHKTQQIHLFKFFGFGNHNFIKTRKRRDVFEE